MSNVNISLEGHLQRIVEAMVSGGFVKTKTEAMRLALFEFDRTHRLVPDEETSFELAAHKILSRVSSGQEKTRPFSLKELD